MRYNLIFAFTIILGTNSHSQDLLNHIHTGYQGWFTAKGDATEMEKWTHWGTSNKPLNEKKLTIEYFPDMREYDKTKLYETEHTYTDGSKVKLFSSNDYETVDLHFKWMKEYGIDGVFLQRFLNPLKNPDIKKHRDKVLEHVIKASKKYGRKFAVMYDLSGYEKSKKKNWKQRL